MNGRERRAARARSRRWGVVSDIALVAGMTALWAIGYTPGQALGLCLIAALVGLVGAIVADLALR